jgi:hypothetical protein
VQAVGDGLGSHGPESGGRLGGGRGEVEGGTEEEGALTRTGRA